MGSPSRDRYAMSAKIGTVNGPQTATHRVVLFICHYLRLNCTLVAYPNNDYGYGFENGTGGTGMVGAVHRDEFDTFEPLFSPTYNRYRIIEFSDPFFYTDILFVTRSPASSRGSQGFSLRVVTVLSGEIWCVFGVTLVVVAGMITLYMHSDSSKSGWLAALANQSWHLITHHYSDRILKPEFIRQLTTFWAIMSLIFSSIYMDMLFFQMLKPPPLPFKDFPTLVSCLEAGRCRLVFHSLSTSYMLDMTDPQHTLGRRIQATYKDRPPLVRRHAEIPNLIQQAKEVYLVWIVSRPVFEMYANNAECSFYVIEAPYVAAWSFPLRRRSPLKPALDRISIAFRENGLGMAFEAIAREGGTCDPKAFQEALRAPGFLQQRTIHSGTVTAALCGLGLGLGVALVAFCGEIMANWCKNRFQSRRRRYELSM